MKTYRIIFWVATGFIFLFESVMPALTSHTDLAVEGIRHLGFPDYFRIQLTICKVIGGIVLIAPFFPHRLKEWAYAGFSITSGSAFIAHLFVDGWGLQTILPLVLLAFIATSYFTYHRLKTATPTGRMSPLLSNI
jgi:hypothetical protein